MQYKQKTKAQIYLGFFYKKNAVLCLLQPARNHSQSNTQTCPIKLSTIHANSSPLIGAADQVITQARIELDRLCQVKS